MTKELNPAEPSGGSDSWTEPLPHDHRENEPGGALRREDSFWWVL